MQLLKPMSKTDYPSYTATSGATAGNTTAWVAGPQGVLVWADVASYIEVGVDATATTASTPIPANVPVPFAVPKGTGGVWRVSAIQVSSSGTLYAKPISGN